MNIIPSAATFWGNVTRTLSSTVGSTAAIGQASAQILAFGAQFDLTPGPGTYMPFTFTARCDASATVSLGLYDGTSFVEAVKGIASSVNGWSGTGNHTLWPRISNTSGVGNVTYSVCFVIIS